MGWGTTLTTDIYYNRKTYNSKYEVESDLQECEEILNTIKGDIKALVVCTEPAKMMPQDEGWEPLEWLVRTIEIKLKDLEEQIAERDNLVFLLDKWDECHDKEGYAIPCPDEQYGKSYLDGDFVRTTENKDGSI